MHTKRNIKLLDQHHRILVIPCQKERLPFFHANEVRTENITGIVQTTHENCSQEETLIRDCINGWNGRFRIEGPHSWLCIVSEQERI